VSAEVEWQVSKDDVFVDLLVERDLQKQQPAPFMDLSALLFGLSTSSKPVDHPFPSPCHRLSSHGKQFGANRCLLSP
jgi:hypothetical protein